MFDLELDKDLDYIDDWYSNYNQLLFELENLVQDIQCIPDLCEPNEPLQVGN